MDRPDPALLPGIVTALRDEYAARGIDAYAIGNGHCYDFADAVLTRWTGEDWQEREGETAGFQMLETGELLLWEGGCSVAWDWPHLEARWSTRPPADVHPEVLQAIAEIEPGHAWIAAGGRHYDAEHPEGVDNHFELMFFRRWVENVAKRHEHGEG